MGKPAKRKIPGAATGAASDPKAASRRTTPSTSKRYTPPVPEAAKVSPRWVPVLMFVFLGAGLVMIVLNYVGLLPGATTNWYLLGGLGLVLAGIITATQWH